MGEQDYWITADQLRIGVYVYLDVGWMDHPFSFNNFKIRSDDQIRTIRSLGLKKLRWDPARSDARPTPAAKPAADAPGEAPAADIAEDLAGGETPILPADDIELSVPADAAPAPAVDIDVAARRSAALAAVADDGLAAMETANKAAMAAKQVRAERLREHRAQIARVQEAFVSAAATVRAINKNIFSKPKETVVQSEQLVRQMVDTFLAAPEVAIQVMSEKPGEEVYLHAINVSVLAMMMGRELGLETERMNMLGVGCLFHDIGLSDVPGKILTKIEPLTRVEREIREMHCGYGVDIAKRIGLAPAVQTIIEQHHEFQDGSGYPKRLKGEAIDLLARIVVIANHYDNLCNPVNLATALTPHEALSQMFAQQRQRFDPKLLQIFIRCLGVFPPGTVVRLSNDVVGLVVSINAARPLKPNVVIYDADVPKHDAIIVDLEAEPEISISQAIRPAQLSRPIFDYLSPRKRVSYYFDADAGKPPAVP